MAQLELLWDRGFMNAMPLAVVYCQRPSYEEPWPERTESMIKTPAIDLNYRFLHELQAVHEDVRSPAALAAFRRLQPTNEITVGQFLGQMQGHKEMWAVVSALGIVDFAAALARHPVAAAVEARPRRTRINVEQKGSLKQAILRVIEDNSPGMNRSQITAALVAGALVPRGLEPTALGEKVRQPLHELIAEGKLHTVGEKRLMKYMVGPSGQKPRKKAKPSRWPAYGPRGLSLARFRQRGEEAGTGLVPRERMATGKAPSFAADRESLGVRRPAVMKTR